MSGGLDKQPPGAKEGEQPNGEDEVQVTEEEEKCEQRHEEKDDDDDTDDDDDDTETETETDDDEEGVKMEDDDEDEDDADIDDIEWPNLLDLTSADWARLEVLMVRESKKLGKRKLPTTPPPEKKPKKE